MKSSEKTKKDKKQAVLHSRRGVILIALLALTVLVVNLITASYSWFTPQSESGVSVGYAYEGQLRSRDCTMNTILGTKAAVAQGGIYVGQINYDPSLTSNEIPSNHEISIASGATRYFKTEIINHDTQNATDIALYIKSIPECVIAVTYPSNSVRTISTPSYDYYLIRNAYIKKYVATDVNGPGLLQVEWFVKNNGTSTITIDLDDLYITYN